MSAERLQAGRTPDETRRDCWWWSDWLLTYCVLCVSVCVFRLCWSSATCCCSWSTVTVAVSFRSSLLTCHSVTSLSVTGVTRSPFIVSQLCRPFVDYHSTVPRPVIAYQWTVFRYQILSLFVALFFFFLNLLYIWRFQQCVKLITVGQLSFIDS